METRKDRRPSRTPGRLPAALAVLLLGWAGCATLDRGHTLVPTRFKVRTGPFLVCSNTPIPEDPKSDRSLAVRSLEALEKDVGRELGLRTPVPTSEDDLVEIYVLDNRQDFDHFLMFHYPDLPRRRAFFLAQGSRRSVYTFVNPRLEEDLRHEATHALLRGAFGDLPLWLDEGLAEYFENDLSRPDLLRPRLEAFAADRRAQWSPNLERLESLKDIRQMSQRDYREAWGWIHLLLNGPEPGKSILMGYLTRTDRGEPPERLRPPLAAAKIDEGRLVQHLESLRPGSMASTSSPDTRARMQDQPIEPVRSAAPRGLLRRLGSWLGF